MRQSESEDGEKEVESNVSLPHRKSMELKHSGVYMCVVVAVVVMVGGDWGFVCVCVTTDVPTVYDKDFIIPEFHLYGLLKMLTSEI